MVHPRTCRELRTALPRRVFFLGSPFLPDPLGNIYNIYIYIYISFSVVALLAPFQEPLGNALDDDITDALRTMDRLAESGLTTFLLGNGRGGGRALAERRAGAYLKSVRNEGRGKRKT